MARLSRADSLVLLLLLLLVAAVYARYWQSPQPALWAEVRNSAGDVARYSLWEPRQLVIAGRSGDSVLQIKAGRIRFISSPCRNQICVHSGWHSHNGEAAACIPNGVSISLGGGSEAIDALVY